MIFFSHSIRIRILQLYFALVCSCSEGLLTTERHHLLLFCLLIFCILCLSIQIKYFVFLDTQCTELKKCISSSTSFLQIGQILSSGLWLLRRSLVRVIRVEPWGGLGKGVGVLITSSRSTIILRFTSHETSIYVFTLLKNRGRAKCQKRYVSPTL